MIVIAMGGAVLCGLMAGLLVYATGASGDVR